MQKRNPWCWLVLSALLTSFTVAAQTTEVLWLGQSAFKITTPGGKTIITDPWLMANPLTPPEYKTLENLGRVDVLLVSHGHLDHFADAPAIALMNKVKMYAPGDLNQTAALLGILPPELLPRFNKSGSVEPAAGIKVTAVHAEHSSVLVWKSPHSGKDETHVGGEPLGFIIELENGLKIYHMGDTGLFGDMKLIADFYKPDVILIPIGGNFTMGPLEAAYAIKSWFQPKAVIPMHYGANPLAKGTVAEFLEAMRGSGIKVMPLKPGEAAKF